MLTVGGYYERLSTSILHRWFVLALCVCALSLSQVAESDSISTTQLRTLASLSFECRNRELGVVALEQVRITSLNSSSRTRTRVLLSHVTSPALLVHSDDVTPPRLRAEELLRDRLRP